MELPSREPLRAPASSDEQHRARPKAPNAVAHQSTAPDGLVRLSLLHRVPAFARPFARLRNLPTPTWRLR